VVHTDQVTTPSPVVPKIDSNLISLQFQVNNHIFNAAESSAGIIKDHLVIFVGNVPDSAAGLAVDAEKNGAAALILKQMDHVRFLYLCKCVYGDSFKSISSLRMLKDSDM
jgi:hypothetical protein